MSQIYGIRTTEMVALYLKKVLAFELGEADEPEMVGQLDFLEELHYGVKLVAQAIRNKSE